VPAAKARQALSAKPQHGIRLSAGRDADGTRTVERGHFDACADHAPTTSTSATGTGRNLLQAEALFALAAHELPLPPHVGLILT
jgi:hypothetical protein